VGESKTTWAKIARRIRVPLSFAFAILYFWLARPTVISMLIGVAVVIPGLLMRALASGHVQKNEQLATTGPYAYTRNPLYLGSLILALGFALAARSWWIAAVLVIMFFAIYLPVIRGEEVFLRGRFPEFDDYARQVPRLLPRLTPLKNGGGAFSQDLYWKHREYNAILGAIAMMAALAGKLIWMSK
jgi:protein-S-isoprenylcysteine O-methyltransferase Ste14